MEVPDNREGIRRFVLPYPQRAGCGGSAVAGFFVGGNLGGIITGIKFQGKAADKARIYINDSYSFTVPAVEALGLEEGQHLSDEELRALETRAHLHNAYEAALRLLKYRPRSEQEVKLHLRRKGLPTETIEATLARLREEGLLDDREFARFWVENRREFKPSGTWRLSQELRQKGISEEIVREVLGDIDFYQEAYRAAARRAPRLKGLAWPEFRKKLAGFLARRGFSYEIIDEVVEKVWRELDLPQGPDETTNSNQEV